MRQRVLIAGRWVQDPLSPASAGHNACLDALRPRETQSRVMLLVVAAPVAGRTEV